MIAFFSDSIAPLRRLLHQNLPLPPHMSGIEEAFVHEAFESNYIAPLGPMVDAFEREFCRAGYIAKSKNQPVGGQRGSKDTDLFFDS